MYCMLALLLCPLVGLWAMKAVASGFPPFTASLPSDMIDNDRPWPLAGFTTLLGPLACDGARCRPPRDDPPGTFNDNDGR